MPEIENITTKTVDGEITRQIRKIAQEQTKKAMKSSIVDDEDENDDDDFNFDGDDEVVDFDDDDNNEDGNTGFELSGIKNDVRDSERAKLLKEIEERDAFDIFTDVGEVWAKDGQIVRYAINKNGKRLTSLDHPLTWEDIQTKFGGGNYKIEARLPALANRYLKAQSKYLGSPVNDIGGREYPSTIKQAEKEKETSIQEAIRLMELQTQREAERRQYEDQRAERLRLEADQKLKEAREEARREAQEKMSAQERLIERMMDMNRPRENNTSLLKEMTPIITALAPVLLKKEEPKDNTKEIFEMMMKMQEMTNKQIEAMNKNFEKQVSSLAESIKEVARAENTSKKSDIDAFQLLKMSQESEARAFEKFSLMNELASEKAREIAELREDANPSFDKESSTFDKLLTTLGPAIASTLLAPKAPSPAPVQALPQPTRAIPAPQPRSSVRHPQASVQPVRRPVVEERTTRNQVQTIEANKNERNNIQSTRGSGISEKSNVGPSVLDVLDEVVPTNASLVPPVENISHVNAMGIVDTNNLETIKGIIFPIAIEAFFSGDETTTLDAVAERSVNALRDGGVNLATVERDFDDNALNDILSDVQEDTHEMIKGLRNEIIVKIKTII